MRFHTTILQAGKTATGIRIPDEIVEGLGAGRRPPIRVTINGYTYSQEGVARLLARLSVLPDLTDVQLQTSALTEIGDRPVIQFTILANVRAGGSTS